jgi:formylglycine-generating enzyme required for sulfatase activity
MVALKGGVFTMGHDGISPQGELAEAKPAHFATAPAFWIDITEVTVDGYRRCVAAGACTEPQQMERQFRSPPCNWFETDRGNHPVNCVSWHQADAYCKWAGKQLPTEEMWEFAARGKTERAFPWGDKVPFQRWGAPPDVYDRLQGSCRTTDPAAANHSDYDTIPVGCAPRGATPEGVLDLAGNVMEWTASPYCDYTSKKCDDARRVVRGGINDWYAYPPMIWSVARGGADPDMRSSTHGFRCAKLDKP